MKRLIGLLVACALALPAAAGWVKIGWDVSPGATAIRSGCVAPGQYERPALPIVGASPGSATIEGLPDSGRCYFALNAGPQDEWQFDFTALTGGRALPGPVRNLAITWSPTPPAPATWAHGFSFRATSSFVADAAGNTYSNGENYPTTRTVGGHVLTVGWEGGAPELRDRSAAAGMLAGVAQIQTFAGYTTRTFRVDLPAPGNYLVRLAAGDQQYGNRAFFELRDGDAVLMAVPETAVIAGQYLDATRTVRSLTQWPAANVAVPMTFKTTTARLVLKRPSTTSSVISFLSFERMP